MSLDALTWAFKVTGLTPGQKFVLIALADKADEEFSCFPSQGLIAAMTSQHERTVRRQLQELEDLGVIARARRFDRGGHRTSDRFYIKQNWQQIPTGQSVQSESLPGTVTAGQKDLRSESTGLPVTEYRPTGQRDRVSLKNHQEPSVKKKPTERRPAHEPPIFDAEVVDAEVETDGQRINRIARTYTDRVKMSKFPAVQGIVRTAVKTGDYTDADIIDALGRLADERRGLTVESLRVALEGFTPTAYRKRTGDDRYRDGMALVARLASQEGNPPPRQIGAAK